MASNPPPALSGDLREALADVPPEERAALERLWLALGEAAPPAAGASDAEWQALRARLVVPAARRAADRRPARVAPRRRAAWTVAALSVTAVLTGVAWLAVPVTRIAPVGETLAVVLPDGSTATLNSGAAVRHARRFGLDVRAVALTGEAFFEVEPGAVPFVVETATARVEVLGTAFNVRAEATETAVALVHGRVRVAAAAPEVATDVSPGEAVVVAPASVAVPAAADVERAASWRNGALAFDDRTLESILGEIARRYGVAVEAVAGTPLDARVSAFYAARPPLGELLGDLGAAANVRFAPTADGYSVRPVAASRRVPRRST